MDINKIICDKCKRELDLDEWYYNFGGCTTTSANHDKGAMIIESGEYCEKCLKELVKTNIK